MIMTEKIELRYNEIKSNMSEVLKYLNEINPLNFDTFFPLATEKMQTVLKLRKSLKDDYFEEELKKFDNYEKELNEMAKQIKETYDNIIETFEMKKHELELELQNFYNKKKLLIYRR